ncbi:MAG: hypothetical protein ACRCZI_13340, partial [Cetobacterium sp.]
MASLGQQLGTAVRAGLCGALAAGNALEDFTRTVLNPAAPDYGYRGRLLYSKYCDLPPPPLSEPPFTGGQCEFCYVLAVTYTISGSPVSSQNGTYVYNDQKFGPIEGVSLREVVVPADPGTNALFADVVCHGSCSAPRSPSLVVQEAFINAIHPDGTATITNVTVTPVEGVDNCGSIEPVPPPRPPEDRTFPINFNFTYNDGTDFNIIGNAFFGFAYFDNDFNVNVPLKFVLNNNVNFTGNFNLELGTINLNFGDDEDVFYRPAPPGNPTTDPSDKPPPTNVPPPQDFDPPFTPNDDPDEDDPEDFPDDEPKKKPTVRRIIGVLVDTFVVGRFPTEIGQLSNPDVYVPDLGLVNFAFLV